MIGKNPHYLFMLKITFYASAFLPKTVSDFCIKYTKELNLNFGAIDLVLYNGEYYFIEINPTGEWSWLQKNTGYKFDKLIVKSLKNV